MVNGKERNMGTFVKTLSFMSGSGDFRTDEDDEDVNVTLEELQQGGATIVEVRLAITGKLWGGAIASYLIVYESDEPFTVGE